MTRRRAIALIFGSLLLVFVLGSIITITGARSQLIADIDADLSNELDLNLQFYDSFTTEVFDDIVIRDNQVATIIINRLGEVELETPAGPVVDPLPRADLPVSRIVDRVGQHFTVDGTDDGPNYRVTVGQLSDGRYLALAAPLDDVDNTLRGLGRTLFITLFAMMTVLGSIFWLLLRASLRPYDDLVDTAEAIAAGDMDRRANPSHDVPGITRLTDSLNTMLDRLQVSFEEREAAEARLKQFAADASHELRTPISTIAGYSEVYLSGAATDADAVDKQMTRINSEAQRMGRLVNDLLTLARLDQGHGLTLEPCDVNSLVADVAADARVVDPDHDLHVVDDPVQPVVMGDRDALHQVCANLIANTRVHAPGARVDVMVRCDDEVVTVSVSDDGPGMSGEVADHIFDRFYRAEAARTSSSRSTGLGLSIVAAIVEAHGGDITVQTRAGTGSTFTITLPLVGPDH